MLCNWTVNNRVALLALAATLLLSADGNKKGFGLSDIENQWRRTFNRIQALTAPARATFTRLRALSQELPALSSPAVRSDTSRRNQGICAALSIAAVLVLLTGVSVALNGARHLQSGLLQLAASHPREAIQEFDACISANHSLIAAYKYRAMAYAALGDTAQALADLDHVLSVHAGDADGLIARAGLYLINQDYDKAYADCSQVLKLQPDRCEAYRLRSLCAMKQGQYAQAVSDCRAYLALSGDSPADRASVLSTMADGFSHQNDFDDALQTYSRALTLAPSTVLYERRARLLESKHRFQDAIQDCSKALSKHASPTAYLLRAQAYQSLGKLEAARQDIDAAIRLDKGDFTLYRQRAKIAMASHDFSQAVADFKKVLAAEPDNQSIQDELVAASKHLPLALQLDTEKTAARATRSSAPKLLTAADARSAQMMLEKGYQLLASGNATQAASFFAAAVRDKPKDMQARLYLARCLLSNGQAADAVDQFGLVSSVQGLGPDDLLRYAKALAESGNLSKSISRYEDYIFVRPMDTAARLSLIALYRKDGRNDKALQTARDSVAKAKTPIERYEFERTIYELDPGANERATRYGAQVHP